MMVNYKINVGIYTNIYNKIRIFVIQQNNH